MIFVSVLYPVGEGSRFDRDYYLGTHVPLLKARWTTMGLTDVRLLSGVVAVDGGKPPYGIIALLAFDSMQSFQSAAGTHGAEIFADIPNFTDVTPVVQVNEPFG